MDSEVHSLHRYSFSTLGVVRTYPCSPQGPTCPSSLANTPSAPCAHLRFPSQYPTVTMTFSWEPSFPIPTGLSVGCLPF